MKKLPLLAVVPAALLAFALLPAFETGGPAYTKRVETKLLAEPKPLATGTGSIAFGKKVKVEEVAGAWLRVSEGTVSGWVFAGNLSETKPAEGKGLDALPMLASETTATAAARPLAPAALEYASQKNLTEARTELEWLLTECQAITPETVDAFLQETKKGEYR